jgi:hypothetical protein
LRKSITGGAVSEQPQLQPCVVYEGDDAVVRLSHLGLRFEHFIAAQTRGHEQRARCLPVHPKTYPGQVMWAETTAELRTQLLALDGGWKIGSTKNYETTFQAEQRIAIAVLGGDVNTGVIGFRHPKAARGRGPVTSKRIRQNLLAQYTLPLEGVTDPTEATDEDCNTWFFLINARMDILYSELSLAITIGEDSRIGQWSERILLPEVPMVGAVTPIAPDDEPPPVVHVDRK